VPRRVLLQESRFPLTIVPAIEALWDHFAADCTRLVEERSRAGRDTVLVFPVGPFDYKRLAAEANRRATSFSRCVIVNMDEFCTEDGDWIPYDHPLSFRSYMDREFFQRLEPALRPAPGNAFFPDPRNPQATSERIAQLGGIDVAYGGIGLDGHWAFNCPEPLSVEEYAALPTRVLRLTPETRCQTAFGSATGDVATVPPKAVTLGMLELLAARQVRVYLIRTWQASLARRCLYGPVTAQYPASLFQGHPGLGVVMVDYVADPPRFGLG
jgi:glucosamine-6-phosphate deaminase